MFFFQSDRRRGPPTHSFQSNRRIIPRNGADRHDPHYYNESDPREGNRPFREDRRSYGDRPRQFEGDRPRQFEGDRGSKWNSGSNFRPRGNLDSKERSDRGPIQRDRAREPRDREFDRDRDHDRDYDRRDEKPFEPEDFEPERFYSKKSGDFVS